MTTEIKVLGTRGSVTTTRTKSGEPTRLFGGDTTSYVIQNGSDPIMVDMGTGSRFYGEGPLRMMAVFTHAHPDHVAGLGDFTPAYIPVSDIEIRASPEHLESIALQYDAAGQVFPAGPNDFMKGIKRIAPIEKRWSYGDLEIESFPLNHPMGCYGYLISGEDGRVGIFADHEHERDLKKIGPEDSAIMKKMEGCDVAFVDGAYLPQEYDPKQVGYEGVLRVGWGHGVDIKAARMALEAGVGRVYITHHSQEHGDTMMLNREREIRKILGTDRVSFARQGEKILLAPILNANFNV
jgi:ribonuclease BN (tRNA processing enzyme)